MRPAWPWRELAVEDEKAREAVVVDPEIGVDRGRTFGDARAGHRVTAEVLGQRGGVQRLGGAGQQLDVHRRHRGPGDVGQPAGRQQGGGGFGEGPLGGAGDDEE